MIKQVANNFDTKAEIIDIQPHGNGLINKTFLITTKDKKYIIQQISNNLGNINKLMENVNLITNFILSQNKKTLKLIKTKNNKCFLKANDTYFRMFEYIDGEVYETITNLENFKKAGFAFADFTKSLENFDVDKINVTMPDFHNTKKRYENFLNAVKNGNQQRAILANNQINTLISKNHYIDKIESLINKGLKHRIIHGDTKINNVIFNDNQAYVIDFDTIMKSYLCYDFGDAIRSGCNTCKEDDDDKKVKFNLNNYQAFTNGYLSVWNKLDKIELQSLLIAPMLVTYELSLRFLTDYLQNDIYFNVNQENHNLIRCKNQIALLEQMEKSFCYMKELFYSNNKKFKIINKINNLTKLPKFKLQNDLMSMASHKDII